MAGYEWDKEWSDKEIIVQFTPTKKKLIILITNY
jgi:hypothetical protein